MKYTLFVFALICTTFIVSAANINKITNSIGAIQVVESVDDFIKLNPNVKLVQLKKEINSNKLMMKQAKEPLRYTLGTPHPADVRLAEGSDTFYYPFLQDVRLELNYPQNGYGGVVHYVEILVDQDSNIGNAYVVAGGLGERYIRLLVEAKQVRYFAYRASFYGSI